MDNEETGSRVSRRAFLKGTAGAVGVGSLAAAGGARPLRSLGSLAGLARPSAQSTHLAFGQAQSLDATGDPLQNIAHNYDYAVFDALTYAAPGKPVVGRLATSWTQLNETTTRFKLRPGVKFSNGDPLTSADVAFSIETILSKGYELSNNISSIVKVQTPDPMTVDIHTAAPDALLDKRVSLVFVVPKSLYQASPAKFAQSPIGSGRYVVTAFQPSTSMSLAANPISWRGQPRSKTISVGEFTSESAFLSSVLAGQLDIAQALPATGIAQLKRDASVDTRLALDGSAVVMRMDTSKPPFNDVRVRQAINHAVDVPTLIAKVLDGAGEPLQGQLANHDCFGFNPKVKAYGYNVRKAKQLLAAAGHPRGFSTTIVGLDVYQGVMEAVAGYLAAIGITATVTQQPFSVWVKEFANGTHNGLFTTGLYYQPFYDADLAFQWPTAPIGVNSPGTVHEWTSAKWNSLLSQERRQLNPTQRLATLHEMGSYLNQQAPYLFLYEEKLVYAVKKTVRGFDTSTGLYCLLDSAYTV